MRHSDFKEFGELAKKYDLLDNGKFSTAKTKAFIDSIDRVKDIAKSYVTFCETNQKVGEIARHKEHGHVLVTAFKIDSDEEGNCRINEYEVINRKKAAIWVKDADLMPLSTQSEILYGDKK